MEISPLTLIQKYIIQFSDINKGDNRIISEKLYNTNSLVASYLLEKSLDKKSHWSPYLETLPEKLDEYMLDKYPKKVYRKRSKAVVDNEPSEIAEIQANIRTIPGIITQRGCTYAGCKGVILGPTRDIVNITQILYGAIVLFNQ